MLSCCGHFGRECGTGRGSRRHRFVGMRAVLSCVSVCRLGWQVTLTSYRLCDDRPGRRGVTERRPGVRHDGGRANCLVLVGCGKMGTAMLRGWVAAGMASGCVVVEPAGVPAGFESAAGIL